MKWFLNVLFLTTIKNVYSKSINFSQQDDKDVNKFLGKILHADKFNELADRIAERAVKKLRDYQETKFTEKLVTKGSALHPRMKSLIKEADNYSHRKLRGNSKHKHGKIDVDAVLKKTVPLSDLRLRYVHLRNKHSKSAVPLKKTNKNNEDEHEEDESIPQEKYKTLSQNIVKDFVENIKTLSNENFQNPYGDGKPVSWDKNQRKEAQEEIKLRTEPRQVHDSASSEKKNTYSGTTRTEGDKQFALIQSPDYKEYHDLLATMGLDSK